MGDFPPHRQYLLSGITLRIGKSADIPVCLVGLLTYPDRRFWIPRIHFRLARI